MNRLQVIVETASGRSAVDVGEVWMVRVKDTRTGVEVTIGEGPDGLLLSADPALEDGVTRIHVSDLAFNAMQARMSVAGVNPKRIGAKPVSPVTVSRTDAK